MALTRLNTNAYASTVDLTSNVTGELPDANIGPKLDYRNIIINGDMQVSQRGTSFASNGYTLDRYTMDESTDGAVTVTQDTDVPSGYGFAKSLKVDCTTADGTIGAAQYCGFTQNIEGQNLQYLKYGTSSAQTLTLSFWVKSVKTGIYCVRFVKEAGGETRYECPIQYTISSASTWEKKTIILTPTAGSTTFIQNSAGAIVNSNASGFRVFFALAVGSNFQGTNNAWTASSDQLGTSSQVNFLDSTSNNFWITGVQLEAGSVATDFEVVPFDQNLQRCQRYYYREQGDAADQRAVSNGMADTTSRYRGIVIFPTTMRANVSATEAGLETLRPGAVNNEVSLDATIDPSTNAVMLQLPTDSGTPYTAGDALTLRITNSTSSFVAFDAEL